MKKKSVMFLLGVILTMTLALTACGDKTEEAIQQKDTEDTEEVSEEGGLEGDFSIAASDTDETEEPAGIQPLHILTGTAYEQHWSDYYLEVLASVSYPIIQLDEDCTGKYPQMARALIDLSDERKETILADYESMIEQSAIQIQEMGEDYFQMYENSEAAVIRRADSNIVSILMEGYYYGGGVHGMGYSTGYTYDAKTGQRLSLMDVVNDVSKLTSYAENELAKYYEAEMFFEGYDLSSYFSEYLDYVAWVLDYNGLTIFFNPYDIAPYAAGSQVVTLSFAEYPDLVKTEYQEIPENYGIQLSEYNPFYYDVDGDGVKDEVSIWGNISEYDRIDKHVILIDDRRFEVEADGYDTDPLFIHTADGSNYLYVQDTSDNDYRMLSIYRFTADGAVECTGVLNNTGWFTQPVEGDNYWGLEAVLTDPAQFRLESRTDTLSTLTGYRDYQISSNGVPVSDVTWYTHFSECYLTLKQALDVDVIDENTGEKTGTMTLNPGTEVLYYRTDDATFADLQLDDGTVVRVVISAESWPRTINGIDIEHIFDGMMFAG